MCLSETEDSSSPHADPTPMSASALVDCQFGSWYPRYAALAPEAEVIPLSDEFAAFLLEDGIVLADDSDAFPRRAQPPAAGVIIDEDDYRPDFSGSDDDEDDGGGDGSGSGDDTGGPAGAASPWALRFPELRAAVDAAIARLGGAVAPKLNWSSPTDAVWVSPSSSLRCRSAEQVVLLLKSSPRAAFDLELCERLRAGAGRADAAPALALRAWRDVPPERELRCFVHGHRPVGICQRDLGQAFPQAAGAGGGERARLRDAVCEFQARHFGSGFARESYALDVVVSPSYDVTLVDVNPIADTTQPLLFDWQQLPYGPRPGGGPDGGGDGDREPGGSGGNEDAPGPSVAAPSSSGGPGAGPPAGAEGGWERVPLLLVEGEPVVRPGMRAACGVPYDLVEGAEEMEEVVRMMQRQQRPGDEGDE